MGTKATHHLRGDQLHPIRPPKPIGIPDKAPGAVAAETAALTPAQRAKLPKPPSIETMRKNLAKNAQNLLGG